MCGFIATITPKRAETLRHRGPDGAGSSETLLPWAHVALDMTRLAIVDRKPCTLPLDYRASVGVVLAYNGEIYNWRELREELSDGRPWESDGDAEVIARAWGRWGVDCLQHLNGMFAFVLVDTVRHELFIARDRAGEKPVFYASVGSGISFASEMKALPVKLTEGSCLEYDTLEFDCLETTMFQGVKRLLPGHYILCRGPQDLAHPTPVMWWSLGSDADEDMNYVAAVEETEHLLVDSIRLRANAEVPVGLLISGGLDSAIIQAVAKIEKLYTVTFPDEGIDNLADARVGALGFEPTPIVFGLDELLGDLHEVIYHLDTPSTWTAICQWFTAKQMAKDGIVVALSGEGADELFAGYSRYRLLYWQERMRNDCHLEGYDPLMRHVFGSDVRMMSQMLDRSDGKMLANAESLVWQFAGSSPSPVARMARVDFYTTMQVLLRMADRMMAAFSIENRSPFLDYRLMELSARMPVVWKVRGSGSKCVLRQVARRLGVADSIVNEQVKRGFYLPWGKWNEKLGNTPNGSRGIWDRKSFAHLLLLKWRKVFFGA